VRTTLFLSLLGLVVLAFGLAGCKPAEDTPAQPDAGREQPADEGGEDAAHGHEHEGEEHAHEGHEGHEHGEMSTEVEEALAELSPEDRAAAEKQKTCPVSGDPLGSMGAPYKVTVEGRDVFLCCAGCEDAIKEDPEKYLAKLDEE
jgi:YHS domain-containing protein